MIVFIMHSYRFSIRKRLSTELHINKHGRDTSTHLQTAARHNVKVQAAKSYIIGYLFSYPCEGKKDKRKKKKGNDI